MASGPVALREAVALRYAAGDAAPVVVAKGRGMVAEEIVRRARDAGVFVHDSAELTALLMQVDLDGRIPPALYGAVAELLAWLHRLERGRTTDGARVLVPAAAARP
jgi:flagellar biosynthesis protein